MRDTKKPQKNHEFIRPSELARRLRTTTGMLKKMAETGQLPVLAVTLGRSTLYRASDVVAWLGGEQ